MFELLGLYSKMNYFFLVSLLAPVPVWILSLKFPEKTWIKYINVPVILNGTGGMPAVKAVNYMCWLYVGITFNLVVYNRYRGWWVRHNYVHHINRIGCWSCFLSRSALFYITDEEH